MIRVALKQIKTPFGKTVKVPALKVRIISGKKVLVPLKRGELPTLDVMPHWRNQNPFGQSVVIKSDTFRLPVKVPVKKPVTIFRSSPKMRPSVQPVFRNTGIYPPILNKIKVQPVIVKAKLIRHNLVKAVIKNPVTKQIKTVIAPPSVIKEQTRPIQITVASGQKPVEKSTLEKLMVPIGIGLITLLMKG